MKNSLRGGTHKPYQLLKWDSDFFGVKVAIIKQCQLNIQNLYDIIHELKDLQVKIVYWSSSLKHDDVDVNKLSGKLVDLKTTFSIDLKCLDQIEFISNNNVELFTASMSVDALNNLAIQSGEYSRFAIDPNIPREKVVELYEIWIKKSICKKIAKEILIIRVDDCIAGMVTLGEKNGCGNIGLLAVDKRFRGKQYGEELVRAAQRWFAGHGYKHVHVVTQGKNIPACKLYMKCGYSVEKIEYFYHFWL